MRQALRSLFLICQLVAIQAIATADDSRDFKTFEIKTCTQSQRCLWVKSQRASMSALQPGLYWFDGGTITLGEKQTPFTFGRLDFINDQVVITERSSHSTYETVIALKDLNIRRFKVN